MKKIKNNYYLKMINSSNEENPKEKFLKKQSYDITAEIYSVSTMNSTVRLSRERWGMLLGLTGTYFLSLNCFYAKVIFWSITYILLQTKNFNFIRITFKTLVFNKGKCKFFL